MEQNVGTLDRAGRAVLAVALLALGWKKEGRVGVLSGCAAGMLLSSATSGYCPLYKVFDFSTAGKTS